jgi:hypothetical protein
MITRRSLGLHQPGKTRERRIRERRERERERESEKAAAGRQAEMPQKWLIRLVGERRATWIERFLKERWMLVGLVLGQFVSLLITSTGFSSSDLARRGSFLLQSSARAFQSQPPLNN